jgi:predicted metal-dependent peptidase
MSRELGDLLAPQINWKDQLREFVKATCSAKDSTSWARPNRRYMSQGIYMPSWIGETIGRVVVGVDTSGSIGAKELNTFLSEVKAICEEVRPSHVDMIYWDSRVAGHEVYEASELEGLVASTKPKGGGGTEPACVEKYIEEKQLRPECVIILTDGFVPNWGGNWNGVPVLWVVAGNPGAMATVGKTIHIND